MILASPTEPPSLLEALRAADSLHVTNLAEEHWGVDFLLCSTAHPLAGVQRKTWPEDFRASLDDGRLALFLRKSRDLEARLLVLEGLMPWWHERSGVPRTRLRGTLFSLQAYHEVTVLWTTDTADTAEAVLQWTKWLSHPHGSLMHRPKLTDLWRDPFSMARRTWFLEGLPGIGPTLAQAMVQRCGGLPVGWTGPDPSTIPGIGPKRPAPSAPFLRRSSDDVALEAPRRSDHHLPSPTLVTRWVT